MSDLACPSGSGSHPSDEADKSSSSQSNFDPSRGPYRTGRKVIRNIYRFDEPVFMAGSAAEAIWLVAVLNAGEAVLKSTNRIWTDEVRLFAKAVLHGDNEHRAWLMEAADKWVAGLPLPPPRGKGTTPAQWVEARSDETRSGLAEDESPVGRESDAP